MRTYKGEIEHSSQKVEESKLRRFAFNSMKKAKEGLMIVTFSAALAMGFTNNVYGDENMSNVQKEVKEEGVIDISNLTPVQLKKIKSIDEIYARQMIIDVFNAQWNEKAPISLDWFKSYLNGKNLSEGIKNNSENLKKLGLSEKEIKEIISTTKLFYDIKFKTTDKLDLDKSASDATLGFLIYFSLVKPDQDMLRPGEYQLNKKFIGYDKNISINKKYISYVDKMYTKENVDSPLEEKVSASNFKKFPEINIPAQVPTTAPVIEHQDPILDTNLYSTADPINAIREAGYSDYLDDTGMLDLNGVSSTDIGKLLDEVNNRIAEREKNLEDPNLTQEQIEIQKSEKESLEKFKEDIENLLEQRKEMREKKVWAGQFGAGLDVRLGLTLVDKETWELWMSIGLGVTTKFNYDEVNGVKYNSVEGGGSLYFGTVVTAGEETDYYATVGTNLGGSTIDSKYLISTEQQTGIRTGEGKKRHDIYITAAQYFENGKEEFDIGAGYTSPSGVGLTLKYNISKNALILGVHYMGDWVQMGVAGELPLNQELTNTKGTFYVRANIFRTEYVEGGITLFGSVQQTNMRVNE